MPDPKQRSIKQDPYHKDQFTYDEENDCYYCPRNLAGKWAEPAIPRYTWGHQA